MTQPVLTPSPTPAPQPAGEASFLGPDFDMDAAAEKMADYPSLGPNYEAGRIIAERVMERFQVKQFRPLIDKFASAFGERLWEDVEASLLSDTETNIQGEIWRGVDRTVEALLSGKSWALKLYVTDKQYGDGEEIRTAIAKLIPAELQDARVADLEKKIAQLEKDLAFQRSRNDER